MAEACELLIASGHVDPFSYTPKKLSALAQLAVKRRRREALDVLSLTRMAYHGKKEQVQKTVKELERG